MTEKKRKRKSRSAKPTISARAKAREKARAEVKKAEETKKVVLIAVLNENGHLIGTRRDEPSADDIVLPDDCDLPLNGTYKWMSDRGSFMPLGTGFPRVATKPPVSETQVLYLLASAIGEDLLPKEVQDWMRWYEKNLKKREEELQIRTRKMREQ